jgi:hypothetical protein
MKEDFDVRHREVVIVAAEVGRLQQSIAQNLRS